MATITYPHDLGQEYSNSPPTTALTAQQAAREYFGGANLQVILRWTRRGRRVGGVSIRLPSVKDVRGGRLHTLILPAWIAWFRSECARRSGERTEPTPVSVPTNARRVGGKSHQRAMQELARRGVKI